MLKPYPFRHGLAEQLHPVGHVLFIVGTELQRRPLCQDDLEGVRTLCAVWATAASTVLSSGETGGGTESMKLEQRNHFLGIYFLWTVKLSIGLHLQPNKHFSHVTFWHVRVGKAHEHFIKLIMIEFHLAASVSGSWCCVCWTLSCITRTI